MEEASGDEMPEPGESPHDLLAKARLGDQKALALLLQLYEKELLRTAQAMLNRALRSLLDPGDLVQSAYRVLIQGLNKGQLHLTSPEELRGLAVRLVKNKIIQHWRRWKCQQRFYEAQVQVETQALIETHPASPGASAQTVELKDAVQNLIQDLNGADRQLVELRLQGYSTAETARQLGLHPDVLRVRLSRLRQRLRKNQKLIEWF
jgi:RNA polymerase sigma factor (sigma-70 family)